MNKYHLLGTTTLWSHFTCMYTEGPVCVCVCEREREREREGEIVHH
jgi:hypothetical protein